jgi:HlyD family secretion protein
VPNQEAEQNIEIRSEEVQEILSHIPNWIIRWGITAILCTIVMILISSWFIKYPDVVTARITITTPVPPVNIVAKSSGAINLLIDDNQNTQKNTILGVIDNPAQTDDVFYLIERCMAFAENSEKRTVDFDSNLTLGSLQSAYLQFCKTLSDFSLFESLQYHEQQINNLNIRINYYHELNRSLEKQLGILKNELNLVEQNFEMDSTLYTQGATTKVEKNRTKAVFLQTKRNYESAKANLINNKIQINQLQNQISDLISKNQEQQGMLGEAIKQSFEQLEAQLETWKQQYLLESPIEGVVSFNSIWSTNQYVKAGEEVFTVIPKEKDPFGRVEMPLSGSGKVDVGQRVNIKLDNYPYQEFGMIQGIVKSKSIVSKNNNYTLTLDLPNGLTSSYKKELVFDREMQGTAEIITKDLRLIERIFNQCRSLLDNAG